MNLIISHDNFSLPTDDAHHAMGFAKWIYIMQCFTVAIEAAMPKMHMSIWILPNVDAAGMLRLIHYVDLHLHVLVEKSLWFCTKERKKTRMF